MELDILLSEAKGKMVPPTHPFYTQKVTRPAVESHFNTGNVSGTVSSKAPEGSRLV